MEAVERIEVVPLERKGQREADEIVREKTSDSR